ncbi:hypothetical protein [Lentibacillus saliphilus]|nr:hypothetical protein [Lentibacillus saliphilus]
MRQEERQSIIAQLALAEGVKESVFKNYTDEQLQERLKVLFGKEA